MPHLLEGWMDTLGKFGGFCKVSRTYALHPEEEANFLKKRLLTALKSQAVEVTANLSRPEAGNLL